MNELLLGCGHKKNKIIIQPGSLSMWGNLTTCDINEKTKPDVVWDLNIVPWIPFKDSEFDAVHAYEVLEHLGRQGDARTFFDTFNQIWRILKPGGYLCATTPSFSSRWLWGDPGHSRVIQPESLTFLDRAQYVAQLGRTSMSDYLDLFYGDFEIMGIDDNQAIHSFILKAVKPARI